MAGVSPERVTDIHTHVVPARFPGGVSGWVPPIEVRPQCGCGRADVYIDGRQFRTITDECWDTDRRLATMDQCGVDRQVLSPMPELLSFWRPVDEAAALADYVNDCLAEMVARSPDRFAALGMAPLQDPDRAIRMLEAIMVRPGFVGVQIGTNIDGLALGDRRFRAFFAAAESLGAAIFIHPVRPVGGYPLAGPAALNALTHFPCETALAAVSIIASGIASEHPGLRLAFSHGGGALSLLLPRLDHGWSASPAVQSAMQEKPSIQARRFFYDTLVYDRETLLFLMSALGKTQLCIGTDQPFSIAEQEPVKRIDALGLAPEDRDLLLTKNAARFLGYAA